MKNFCLLLFFCAMALSANACPAYPYKVEVQLPDGFTHIYLYGDEYCKWGETEEGYTIVQNKYNQWCYAKIDSISGYISATSFLVKVKKEHSTAFLRYIDNTPKHLRSSISKQHKTKNGIGKAIGERRILVILMEFADVKFSKTNEDFYRLFNQTNYQEDGAQGSVKDYYQAASYGQLSLSCDVYGPYTASKSLSYYGNNSISGSDVNPFALFDEAVKQVSKDCDLQIYDGDGDGYVDNVHIIYAGYGEEAGGPASAIWAHEMTFGQDYEVGSMKIDKYSCAPELRGNSGKGISRIGPHCHEIGHALGAMDFYDTDYKTGGEYSGTGLWDVMAEGSWNNQGVTPADFNPYVKAMNYGWIKPHALPVGEVTISPSCISPENYYLLSSTDADDYYLVENRSRDSYGAGLPGEGLLFYHIHNNILNAQNKINATAPQMCYIVCASSKTKRPSDNAKSYGDINSSGCPFPGSSNNTSFGSESTPQAFFWDNKQCGINIRNITKLGNGNIRLYNASEGVNNEPVETTLLLLEGFEKQTAITVVDQQHGVWETVANPTGSVLATRPFAHEGINSMQLSAKRNLFDNAVSTIEIECPAHDSSKDLYVTVYYTSSGLASKRSNTLRIGYKNIVNNEFTFVEIKSTANNTWNPFTTSIPGSVIGPVRIEGIAIPGTILAIDDITIEQMAGNTASVDRVRSMEEDNIRYSFSVSAMPMNVLMKGLNIVRMNDGSYRKVIIR